MFGIKKSLLKNSLPTDHPPVISKGGQRSAVNLFTLSLSIQQFLHNESSVCIHCTEYPFKVLSLKKIVTYILQVRIGFILDWPGWLVCRRAGDT